MGWGREGSFILYMYKFSKKLNEKREEEENKGYGKKPRYTPSPLIP